jgi:2-polyprenyl-6-methoxyphenol hydroxylase-like FAD-dependent oxidoreductase
VQGKIEPFKIDLYRMQQCARARMVLIGDAYQSVCPSTGTGLSKVLTDVDVLCNEFVPRWMAAGSIATSDVAAFYAHERKKAVDDHALRDALAGRDSVLATSLRWRVRRLVHAWRFARGG